MSRDPPRLIDSHEVEPAVRRDLEALGRNDPGYDVDAGLQRFRAVLAVPAGPALSMKGVALKGIMVQLLKWTVIVAIVGGGTAAVVRSPEPEPMPLRTIAQTRPHAGPDVRAPVADVVHWPVVAAYPADRPSVVVPVRSSSVARPSPAVRASGPSEDDRRLAREIEATAAIRAALPDDPARALDLIEAAERTFAGGVLTEERLALQVLGLARLGRADEADARARAFLSRYPRSAMADRVRASTSEVIP